MGLLVQLHGKDLVGLGQAEATVQRFATGAYGAQDLNQRNGHERSKQVKKKKKQEEEEMLLKFDI